VRAAFKPTDARREVNQMRVIGVDVGKKHCQACVMNEQGVILDEFPFE
jgi:activator of 2-hydroxyglutaryl-CoA dehydratase